MGGGRVVRGRNEPIKVMRSRTLTLSRSAADDIYIIYIKYILYKIPNNTKKTSIITDNKILEIFYNLKILTFLTMFFNHVGPQKF